LKKAKFAIQSNPEKAAKQIRINLEEIGILSNTFSPFDVEMLIANLMNESFEESLDEASEPTYKVAGRTVTLNKGEKEDGTDWTVTFQNGDEKPLSDVLSLIKPFPKGIKESLDEAVFKYTEDDINMTNGFYGTLDLEYDDEKKVQKMYLQAIKDLMKAYRVSEETAIAVLDSREGRHFADFIISKTTKPNIVDAMAAYFGSAARLYNFLNSVEESIVYESAYIERDQMMNILETKYKFPFVRTTEEFDGSKGGIWTSGESSPVLGGKKIYNYYAEGAAYELGVLKRFEQAINKLGWYSEWHDAGTMMIWPL
jgi:hypothetical protein